MYIQQLVLMENIIYYIIAKMIILLGMIIFKIT